MNELSLFSGAGGGILGAHLLGWRTVCAVEFDEYARNVLIARQNDGCLRPFPIWDDVRTFNGRPWASLVDVVTGGFPCQDISVAGKGAGITGARSGLWGEMARIIGEVRPRYVLVENSPALTSRGLGTVLGDLAALGYDAKWGVLGAHHAGAPHKRDRIWIAANTRGGRFSEPHGGEVQFARGTEVIGAGEDVADALRAGGREGCGELGGQAGPSSIAEGRKPRAQPGDGSETVADSRSSGLEELDPAGITDGAGQHSRGPSEWWACDPGDDPQSGVGRVAHGISKRVDRLRCLGNAQVPAVVRLAWETLSR